MSEFPTQYERDLRSASKEVKRTKDAASKWSYGIRASPGVSLQLADNAKPHARPLRKNSEMSSPHQKDEHNIIKMRGNWNMPSNRVRGKISALEELNDTSRSVTELLPGDALTLARRQTASDNALYSFDRLDTPGKPLALDLFVKTSGRDTERLVEKEYEILDGNGETLKGRKARRTLRKAVTDISDLDGYEEDDGFELV